MCRDQRGPVQGHVWATGLGEIWYSKVEDPQTCSFYYQKHLRVCRRSISANPSREDSLCTSDYRQYSQQLIFCCLLPFSDHFFMAVTHAKLR